MSNFCFTFYDGHKDFSFDCSGAKKCKYALCEIMPPEEDDLCVHRFHGSCTGVRAQGVVMEKAARLIKAKIKEDKDNEV